MSAWSTLMASLGLDWWGRFGESSGTTLTDSSGNGHDGTWTGAPTLGATGLVSGDSDTAVTFSGSGSDYGTVPYGAWMNRTTGFSMGAVVKTTDTGLNYILQRWGASGVAQIYGLDLSASNVVRAYVKSGGTNRILSATVAGLRDGNRHLIAMDWDPTTSFLRLYVDGSFVTQISAPGAMATLGSQDLDVGRRPAGSAGDSLNGTEDEGFFGPNLTAAQHGDLWAALAGPAPTTINSGLVTTTTTVLAGSVAVGQAVAAGLVTQTSSALACTTTVGQALMSGLVTQTTTVLAATVVEGIVRYAGLATESTTVLPGVTAAGALVEGGLVTETTTVLAGAIVHGEDVFAGLVTESINVLGGTIVFGYSITARNRTSGRPDRAQRATVLWEPPVVEPSRPRALLQYDVAVALTTPTIVGTKAVAVAVEARRRKERHRILVGNVDVTDFRDVETPELDYTLIQPLLYGPATLRLPQVIPWAEQPGTGDLTWLRKETKVVQQRVDADGNVTATDYKGFVVAWDTGGEDLVVQVAGEASGRAALREKQVPLYRTVKDIGRHAYFAINTLGLRFRPPFGPETGIRVETFGGVAHSEYLNQLCALAVTRGGAQYTIMPGADGAYRLVEKDLDTVHATFYPHGDRNTAALRTDLAEDPSRIYGTGVTPEGMRVLGGVYPGMRQGDPPPYPFNGGGSFGEGTVDSDTDTGDGVTVMINKLRVHNYMSAVDSPGGYDEDVVDAVTALQDDAGIPATGTMNRKTWAALYDLDATGFDIRGARIEPLAQRPYTRKWRRSAGGAIIGRSPNYDPHRVPVDRNVDYGVSYEVRQMRQWSRNLLARGADGFVGTLTVHTGALIAGDHTPGDPINEADVVPAKDVKPGWNIRLPLLGLLVHVSAVQVSGGLVRLDVSTDGGDSIPVWERIRRNRDSRRSPRRQWLRDHRSSGQVKDSITEFSEVGGLIDTDVTLRADRWRVFQVSAGRAGTIARLRLRSNPNAELAVAVFGRDISEAKLQNRIGSPLSEAAKARWKNPDILDELDDQHLLLYVSGNDVDPGGYSPGYKSKGDPLTGRLDDLAQFSYFTDRANVLYVAVYADRDCVIRNGRIMWPQLEAGA